MSRAFVKEPDGDTSEELPPLPESPHPNRVTPVGLVLLRGRLDEALRRLPSVPAGERPLLAREIAWLERRIAKAIPEAPPADRSRAALGAYVTVQDEHGERKTWQIVGEDEVAPEQGRVSWVSPLARALEGARVGDIVTWERPAGNLEIVVQNIRYEDRTTDH